MHLSTVVKRAQARIEFLHTPPHRPPLRKSTCARLLPVLMTSHQLLTLKFTFNSSLSNSKFFKVNNPQLPPPPRRGL